MAKRTHNVIKELTEALSKDRCPPDDYFEKAIDAAVGHERMLVGLYGLLAAGVIFLLLQVEMSPWAGAAMVTAWVLFVVGLAYATMHIVAYNKMLLLADVVRNGEETVDLETGGGKASPEVFLHAEAMARCLQSSESHYLFLGLLCAGGAVVIDHWQYAWRAFAVLAGVVILLLLIEFVPQIINTTTSRSGDTTEDETEE